MTELVNPIWWMLTHFGEGINGLRMVAMGVFGLLEMFLIVLLIGGVLIEGTNLYKKRKMNVGSIGAFFIVSVLIIVVGGALIIEMGVINASAYTQQIEEKKEEWSIEKEEELENVRMVKEDGQSTYTVYYNLWNEKGLEVENSFEIREEQVTVVEEEKAKRVYTTYTPEVKKWVKAYNKENMKNIYLENTWNMELYMPENEKRS